MQKHNVNLEDDEKLVEAFDEYQNSVFLLFKHLVAKEIGNFDIKAFIKRCTENDGSLDEHLIEKLRAFVEIDEFRMLMKSETVKEPKGLLSEVYDEAEHIFNYTVEQIESVLTDERFKNLINSFVTKIDKKVSDGELKALFEEFRNTVGSHFCSEMTKRIADFDLHSFLKELRNCAGKIGTEIRNHLYSFVDEDKFCELIKELLKGIPDSLKEEAEVNLGSALTYEFLAKLETMALQAGVDLTDPIQKQAAIACLKKVDSEHVEKAILVWHKIKDHLF